MSQTVKILGVDGRIVFAILIAVLILPSGFFVYRSHEELKAIQREILDPPTTILEKFVDSTRDQTLTDVLQLERYATQIRALAERDTVLQRNLRARAALATRTWLYFMCLIFGAILTVIGVSFVLGRIVAPVDAQIEGSGFKLTLVTSSPGLLICLFGCGLIAIPIVMQKEISVSDGPAYLLPRVGAEIQTRTPEVDPTEIDKFIKNQRSGESK
tara:strand:- start:787 stop:1428 length:642 start_codon:yes stop_codon:yes gene_type:complete